MSWLHRELETMDPSIFLQYSPSPPNGLPQESKLATYMNRSTSTPTRSLNQALGKLSLESSPTAIRKVVITEFVPMNYFAQPSILQPESPESSSPSTMAQVPNTAQVHQENVGGTTYFYSTNSDSLNTTGALNSSASIGPPESCMSGPVGAGAASPYATQIYSGTPTHIGPMTSKSGLAQSFYMPETIRSEIYERNDDVFLQTDLRQYPDLPENVEMYSELTPLESAAPHSIATSYRATHRQSGEHYALRRLHSYSTSVTKRLEMWKQIDHPNVVRLHEWFTTKAFGDHSMVLVYSYHPACTTLMNKYLSGGAGNAANDANGAFHDPFSSDPDAPRPYTHQKNAMLRAVASGALLPEAVLWSLLVQLTAALRAVHTAGLACSLDPTKVVMNGCRVRISWCGATDALHANSTDVAQAQQDDLTALGRLALALACRTIHCDNLAASMELVARTYSADLKNLILYLLSSSTARRSVTDLMPMIGARFYTQVEALERRADVFEDQLAREIDNGRLLRILIKLGIVNERPELNLDASWSETGDRYMLKLFRDYLFHSVTADGRPWLDQAHLAHCLNQLDGGTPERVELMSRDEQSVLVVSYAELKHCLEQAFEEVMQAAAGGP
ncbi:PAN2-PAN3 deadenylation complex subunit PAN3 [Helicoverpa armigera]|uniref:PAN2-PAN3 deadenylation complex subunit PAN3 n=1 Tax=Helicoverpa armigera TaxID=29058 RepID=UPI000B39B44D|nr:PAN2-PAN3 deadenylation complex subunit PAN3 [Helicoverpa armigera]XP_047041152.1 PAN2-PAN3 deadenylation complex subunit PAN3 [Helicoverpa zea]